MLFERHPLWHCAKTYYNGDLIIHDPQETFNFELPVERRDELKALLEQWFSDPNDELQTFCRGYVGMEGHDDIRWPTQANRYSLSLELIDYYLPYRGLWVDLGCMGFEPAALRQRRPDVNWRLFCFEGGYIELDDKGLHHAYEPGNGRIELERVDLEREPLPIEPGTADVVSSFETIEHFKFGPQYFIVEVNKALKMGGVLIFTTPNAHSALAFERMINNSHPAECRFYHRNIEFGRVHPAEYDRDQIALLAMANGFELVTLVTFDGAPFSDRLTRIVQNLKNLREAEGLGDLPPDYGEKWLLIARKVADVTEPSYPEQLFDFA